MKIPPNPTQIVNLATIEEIIEDTTTNEFVSNNEGKCY
jgi:hypothetical protein